MLGGKRFADPSGKQIVELIRVVRKVEQCQGTGRELAVGRLAGPNDELELLVHDGAEGDPRSAELGEDRLG